MITVTQGTVNQTPANPFTVTAPTATTDELVVLVVGKTQGGSNSPEVTSPSGFTDDIDEPNTNGVTTHILISHKVGDGTAYTATVSQMAGGDVCALPLKLAGVNTTSPVATTAETNAGTAVDYAEFYIPGLAAAGVTEGDLVVAVIEFSSTITVASFETYEGETIAHQNVYRAMLYWPVTATDISNDYVDRFAGWTTSRTFRWGAAIYKQSPSVDHTVSRTDGAGAVDSHSRTVTNDRTRTESVGITKVVQRAGVYTRTRTDVSGMVEAIQRVHSAVATRTDATGLSDSRTLQLAAAVSVLDLASATDSAARAVAYARSGVETAELSDSATRGAGYLRTGVSQLGLHDSVQALVALARTANEALGLLDPGGLGAFRDFEPTEAVGLADSVQRVAALFRSRVSVVGAVDSHTRASTQLLTMLSAAGLTDTDSIVKALARTLTNALSGDDTGTPVETYSRGRTDSVTLLDSVGRQLGTVQTYSSGLGAVDVIQLVEGTQILAGSAVALVDTMQREQQHHRLQVDALGLSGVHALLKITAHAVVAIDQLTLDDDILRGKAYEYTLVDEVSADDLLAVVEGLVEAVRLELGDPLHLTVTIEHMRPED